MRYARLWLGLLILCLLSNFVSAEFEVNTVIVTDSVFIGENAVFEFEITNLEDQPDRYVFSSEDVSYILFVDQRPKEVLPGETGLYRIEIAARSGVSSGVRKVPVKVRSVLTGEIKDVSPVVRFLDPNRAPVDYAPSVFMSVGLSSEKIDPRDSLIINVHLRNRNPRIYGPDDPLKVVISSDLFYDEFKTQLGSVNDGGEKTPERRIELDPYTPPGLYSLTVKLFSGDDLVSEVQKSFEVIGYTDVQKHDFVDSKFLKKITTVKFSNFGNMDAKVEFKQPLPFWQRLFTTASSNFEVIDFNGSDHLYMEFDLAPKQEVTIVITKNYRLLGLLLLVIIISVVAYYIMRSPLVLRKEASFVSDLDEGSTEIKTRLFIKNRSSKQLRNLKIIDTVPGVATLIGGKQLGTLEPTKVVKKKGKDTLIRWDLDVLEPFEERIITYRVKTPVALVGDVTLPGMKVRFETPKGKERVSHSSEVTISKLE